MYYDNGAIIQHVKNDKNTKRKKHHDVKYQRVGEYVQEGIIKVQHVRTDSMIVDPLTKALNTCRFPGACHKYGRSCTLVLVFPALITYLIVVRPLYLIVRPLVVSLFH